MGVREKTAAARKAGEFDRWKPPDEDDDDRGTAPGIPTSRSALLKGAPRQYNFKFPVTLMDRVEQVAKKDRSTMTKFVEEAILAKLEAACESCGR